VRTDFDGDFRLKARRLASLKSMTAELERQLAAERVSPDPEPGQLADSRSRAGAEQETCHCGSQHPSREYDTAGIPAYRPGTGKSYHHDTARPGHRDDAPHDGHRTWPDDRTEAFVNHGRRSRYYQRLSRRRQAAVAAAVLAVLVVLVVIRLATGGASWPASVTRVQTEAAQACQNVNVKSEPDQVNFACAKSTRQILWVFALMTSADNPNFVNAKTGREGLEPITPAQGGELAWSLNLHHPYDPTDPVDSLEVAARAINNIIGGATLTGSNGKPLVQPGLDSSPANCARYTGSAAVTARDGFPGACKAAVSTPAGQAALVTDVYQKWVVGASPGQAQEAAVLFANAANPGDPQVQVILRHLPQSRPLT
jgi:hypothetical protein